MARITASSATLCSAMTVSSGCSSPLTTAANARTPGTTPAGICRCRRRHRPLGDRRSQPDRGVDLVEENSLARVCVTPGPMSGMHASHLAPLPQHRYALHRHRRSCAPLSPASGWGYPQPPCGEGACPHLIAALCIVTRGHFGHTSGSGRKRTVNSLPRRCASITVHRRGTDANRTLRRILPAPGRSGRRRPCPG